MNIKFFLFYALSNIFFFLLFDLISSKLKIFSKTFFKKKEIKKKIPLIGGLLILMNFNLTFFFCDVFFTQSLKSAFFLILMVSNFFFLFGYLDDRLNLGPYMKFFLFITFCFVILTNFDFLVINELRFSFFDKIIYLNNYSLVFTMFSIFVFINALNMFDGIKTSTANSNANNIQGVQIGDYTIAANLLANQDNYDFNILSTPGLNLQNGTSAITTLLSNV